MSLSSPPPPPSSPAPTLYRRLGAAVHRAVARALTRLFHIEVRGLHHYHAAGPRVLLIANHVSLLDALLLYFFLPERPTFAINTQIAERWYFKPFFVFVDLFRLDPLSPLSTKSLIAFLKENRKAVVFPEGRITLTGALMKIYEGPGMIADHSGATLLPIGIAGAEFSKASYLGGRVRQRWFPRITLTIHPPTRIQLPPDLHGHERRRAAARQLSEVMYRVALANQETHHSLFAAVVAAAELHGPGRLAVFDAARRRLTYRGLIARTLLLGEAMAAATEAGEAVGLLLPTSVTAVVAFLALSSRGRVPALLNYSAGREIVHAACALAGVKTVYTSRVFVERAHLEHHVATLAQEGRVVYLEDLAIGLTLRRKIATALAAWRPRAALARLAVAEEPDATAVILFTSGSEGAPKGVALTHANLLTNCAQASILFGLAREDLIFNALPIFHSFGLTAGTLFPLLHGARCYLHPSPLHYRLIPELCYELRATVLFGTNSFFTGYARYAHPYDLHHLRYVIAGAEKLHAEVRALWVEKFGIRILEGYGVTEASPVIAVNTPIAYRSGSVGRLLAGMEYYLEPVEGIAEGGRLVVRGPNVMKGYIRAGSGGVPTPPATARGPGWYDTGDIARFDAEGFLYIVGRAKRFAKVSGEMVSLTAIEEFASRIWPGHLHAAAALADTRKGERIVLVSDYARADRHAFLEAARQHGLGEILLPRAVLVVEHVPLLPTGKIDYPRVDAYAREHA